MAQGSVNKVIILGRLGQDPEVKYMTSGKAVTHISVATSESWKDKNTQEKQERTEWHRVVFFGRLAEVVNEYLNKGSQVYIEGQLRTNKWQDKGGQDRYTTEIIANEMTMLGSKSGGSTNFDQTPAPSRNDNFNAPPNTQSPNQNAGGAPNAQPPNQNAGGAPNAQPPNQNAGGAPNAQPPNQNTGGAPNTQPPNQNTGGAPNTPPYNDEFDDDIPF